ncbi:MAG: squalene/phytoene synthase family protein [Polyangiaceae bacterium]|nr:squalene/phytoene synthase family protein [Polyangiaceae bacterium]
MESDGLRIARELTKAKAKSFYFASNVLRKEDKEAAYAVYAFCRRCDDAVDGVEKSVALRSLASLDETVESVFGGKPLQDPVFALFQQIALSRSIPKKAVHGLLEGMRHDVESRKILSWRDFEHYCYLVAGTVGEMMAAVFGAPSYALPAASSLGQAMQMTNILRDVAEDLRWLGRVYLPEEALDQYGIGRADLLRWSTQERLWGERAERFRRLAGEISERAKGSYEGAEDGIVHIPHPSARSCVRLMRSSYREILFVIEESKFDVFEARRVVPTWRKVTAALRF